jgi:hypothetical protein
MKKLFFLSALLASSIATAQQDQENPKFQDFPGNVTVIVNPDKTCVIRIASSVGFGAAMGSFGLLGVLAQAATQVGPVTERSIDGFERAEAFAKSSGCVTTEVSTASAADDKFDEKVAIRLGSLVREKGYATSMAMTQWGFVCGNACAYIYLGGATRHERFKASLVDGRGDSGIVLNGCLNSEYLEKMVGATARDRLSTVCGGKIPTKLAKELNLITMSN